MNVYSTQSPNAANGSAATTAPGAVSTTTTTTAASAMPSTPYRPMSATTPTTITKTTTTVAAPAGTSGQGSQSKSSGKPNKIALKGILVGLVLLVALVGGVVAWYLSTQQQDIRQKAFQEYDYCADMTNKGEITCEKTPGCSWYGGRDAQTVRINCNTVPESSCNSTQGCQIGDDTRTCSATSDVNSCPNDCRKYDEVVGRACNSSDLINNRTGCKAPCTFNAGKSVCQGPGECPTLSTDGNPTSECERAVGEGCRESTTAATCGGSYPTTKTFVKCEGTYVAGSICSGFYDKVDGYSEPPACTGTAQLERLMNECKSAGGCWVNNGTFKCYSHAEKMPNPSNSAEGMGVCNNGNWTPDSSTQTQLTRCDEKCTDPEGCICPKKGICSIFSLEPDDGITGHIAKDAMCGGSSFGGAKCINLQSNLPVITNNGNCFSIGSGAAAGSKLVGYKCPGGFNMEGGCQPSTYFAKDTTVCFDTSNNFCGTQQIDIEPREQGTGGLCFYSKEFGDENTCAESMKCDSVCTLDSQCKAINAGYSCTPVGSIKKCRLTTNTTSTTCTPPTTTKALCRGACVTDADCGVQQGVQLKCAPDKICWDAICETSTPPPTTPPPTTPPPGVKQCTSLGISTATGGAVDRNHLTIGTAYTFTLNATTQYTRALLTGYTGAACTGAVPAGLPSATLSRTGTTPFTFTWTPTSTGSFTLYNTMFEGAGATAPQCFTACTPSGSTTCANAAACVIPVTVDSTPALCTSLQVNSSTPRVGDTVTLTCAQVSGATRYEFQIRQPGGTTFQAINPTTAGGNTATYTVAANGDHLAQCRSCTGAAASTCEAFDNVSAQVRPCTVGFTGSTNDTYSCDSTCSTDAQCQTANANYICYNTGSGNHCRLLSNRNSSTCQPATTSYTCNSQCETNAQCQTANSNYICNGGFCRLSTNLSSTTCTPTTITTTGCNQVCTSNGDCTNPNHICVTIADGSNRCRLDSYPSSSTCSPTTAQGQPVLPTELPKTGAEDTLKYAAVGAGAIILGALGLLLL